MSGRILEPPGVRYFDRPKPGRPGVIERTYLDGGYDVYGAGTAPAVVERTATRAQRHSGVKIVLTPEAQRSIDHYSMWETAQDQCETGGALFGIATLDEVLITRATGPGPAAVRKTHELEVDRSVSEQWEIDDHIRRLGLWHSHPNSASARPSPTDIVAWQAGLASIRSPRAPLLDPHYVGVIVTRGERGWGLPTISAWVVSELDGEAERATVIER
jgi:integrative and conjugative element protein (TIGR02256 family)